MRHELCTAETFAPLIPHKARDYHVRIVLPATETAVRRGLASLKQSLAPFQYSRDELGALEIVLAETLNNIVEHAYANGPAGNIEICLNHASDGLWCTVIDDGAMMPDGEVPLGRRAKLNCEVKDLPEGGFGWFLIRELAHDLVYERREDRNYLCFRIAIGELHEPRRDQ